MKAFVFACLLAVAATSPIFPSAYSYFPGYHAPLVFSPVAPLVYHPSSGAVVPADTPELAAAKVAHAAAHHEALSRGKRSPAYYGPPAPLNSDGTVAQTPEIAAAAAYQQAAHAQEYRRLADAAALAAAHPDNTSPPDNSGAYNPSAYNSGYNGGYNAGYNSDYNGAYNPAPAQQWSGRSYNSAPVQPAPLNHDGTVAQTPEYQSIAAAHAAAHHQAPVAPHYGRKRRSVALNPDGTVAPTPEVAAATAAHYAALAKASGYYGAPLAYGYSPVAYHGLAPLKADGTVAETPEVAALSAAHHAAQVQQLHQLAAQDALAAAAGGDEYAPALAYAAVPYAHGYAHLPAPLNPDGTVAHTPEYLAIAASHAAARYV